MESCHENVIHVHVCDPVPDNCGSSSPDEEVISDTKYDEEYSQDAVSPVHDHREDKTKTVSKYSKLRVFNFFSKKGGTADAMGTNKASAAAPLSFLARNSPQKLETFQVSVYYCTKCLRILSCGVHIVCV